MNQMGVSWQRAVVWAGIPLLIGALNEFALYVALPSLQRDSRIDVGNVGWIFLAFLIADAAVLIAAGRVGDRFGRRKTAAAGLVVAILGSVVCLVAANFPLLIVGRIVEGLGVGILFSGLLAIIADAAPAQSRGRAFGLWAFIGAIAVVASPVIGGVLAEYASWRWIFGLNALIGIVALVTLRSCIPHKASASTAASHSTSRLLSSTNYFAGTAVITVVYAAIAFTWLLLVFFLTSVQGLRPTVIGLTFLAYGLWWLILTPFTGRLADRIGSRPLMLIGSGLGAVGYLVLVLASSHPQEFLIVLGLSLISIGVTLVVPATNAVTMSQVPPELRGAASGVNMTSRIIGSIAGLVVSATLLESLQPNDIASSAQVTWSCAIGTMLIAFAIAAFFIRSGAKAQAR